MKIEAVQAYRCPMCKAIHKIAPGASLCLKKCIKEDKAQRLAEAKDKALDVIRNSVRLEATSLTEAINLLVKNSKTYYKVDLTIDSYPATFGVQSISHSCPLKKRTNWGSDDQYPIGHLGWRGQWKGKIRGSYKTFFGDSDGRPSFSDYTERWRPAFFGFHTGTGSGGSDFDIGGEIFLEDFPKIYEKEIKKYEGNKLCCTVNRWRKCTFCDHYWCNDHGKYIREGMSYPSCPFDGYKLV